MNKLRWTKEITTKSSQRLYFIILLKRAGIDPYHLINIYTSIVRSILEYACQVWYTSLTKKQTKQIEYIHRRAMRVIFQDKLCRKLFIIMQQPTHKLHHLLPLSGKLRTQLETLGHTVCRVAELQDFIILLYHML